MLNRVAHSHSPRSTSAVASSTIFIRISQIEQYTLQVIIVSGGLCHQCSYFYISQRIVPSTTWADTGFDTHFTHHSYSTIDQPSALVYAKRAEPVCCSYQFYNRVGGGAQ
jgi:uncharacterized protein YcfL